MSNLHNIDKFRAWCHKVLPLVYDDSLSYYEFLCKIQKKLNEVIDTVNEQNEYIVEKINEEIERAKEEIDGKIAEGLADAKTEMQEQYDAFSARIDELLDSVKGLYFEATIDYDIDNNTTTLDCDTTYNDIKAVVEKGWTPIVYVTLNTISGGSTYAYYCEIPLTYNMLTHGPTQTYAFLYRDARVLGIYDFNLYIGSNSNSAKVYNHPNKVSVTYNTNTGVFSNGTPYAEVQSNALDHNGYSGILHAKINNVTTTYYPIKTDKNFSWCIIESNKIKIIALASNNTWSYKEYDLAERSNTTFAVSCSAGFTDVTGITYNNAKAILENGGYPCVDLTLGGAIVGVIPFAYFDKSTVGQTRNIRFDTGISGKPYFICYEDGTFSGGTNP